MTNTTPTTPRKWRTLLKQISLHLFCWTIYIFHEMFYVWYAGIKADPIWVYVVHYSLNILLFYLTAGLLTAVFDHRLMRLSTGLMYFFLSVIIFLTLKTAVVYAGHPAGWLNRQKILANLPWDFYRGLTFIILASFYWIAGRAAYFRQKATAADNAFLRQQINPHFLFNTLNFIYSKVIASEEAARCVSLLSDLMRYSLRTTGSNDAVPLEEEMEQIGALIELNRLRYDRPLYLETDFNSSTEGRSVIPLALLTLTENIFKHGDLFSAADPARLTIRTDNEGGLHFKSYNLKKARPASATGEGLKNTRRRLEHAYGQRYRLEATDLADHFEINLYLP